MSVNPESQIIARIPLLTVMLNAAKNISEIRIVQIDLSPGQRVGRHVHPVPVVGCITSGAIHFQVHGQSSTILRAGEAFYEPDHTEILHFDNASLQEPVTFVAFYLMGGASDELIKML